MVRGCQCLCLFHKASEAEGLVNQPSERACPRQARLPSATWGAPGRTHQSVYSFAHTEACIQLHTPKQFFERLNVMRPFRRDRNQPSSQDWPSAFTRVRSIIWLVLAGPRPRPRILGI